jgi:hypothetical protein
MVLIHYEVLSLLCEITYRTKSEILTESPFILFCHR